MTKLPEDLDRAAGLIDTATREWMAAVLDRILAEKGPDEGLIETAWQMQDEALRRVQATQSVAGRLIRSKDPANRLDQGETEDENGPGTPAGRKR